MNWTNIATVYLKELKDMLRDKRTIRSMIIIPTLVMPALSFGIATIARKVDSANRAEIPKVMILGGEDSPGIVSELKASGKFVIVEASADWKERISEKRVRAAVTLPPGFEAGLSAGSTSTVPISYYQGESKSGYAAGQLETFFRELREKTIQARLADRGLAKDFAQPFETKRENVAPPEKVGGNSFGGIVPYFIIILCFTGAMYPAMDLTAGEKERGTMETLLCSPISRTDIVLGKFLMVLTSSLAAMVLSLTSMTLSFIVGGMLMANKVPAAAAQAAATSTPLPMVDPAGVLGVLAMVLPVAVLFSAILFTVSLFAKSFKEAQSYVGPMIIVVIMPAIIGMLPGIDLNAGLALVPILNLSLVCKEMLSGVWHWHYIALIFGSTCVYAGIALALAVKMFNREDVIFRT
jgi:sodium transport system permease protein